jgi:hypothetical protein
MVGGDGGEVALCGMESKRKSGMRDGHGGPSRSQKK